jgi:hypothetical protein
VCGRADDGDVVDPDQVDRIAGGGCERVVR